MKSNSIWALIAGLALGFIIGREYSGGKGGSASTAGAAATNANGPTEIPKDWLTESDIGAADQMKELTPQQRYAALKVLNEKPCDCGCPHGSVAKCKKDDPGCPRAPTVISTAIAQAKLGKTADEILAAVKKPDSPGAAPQAPAAGPQKVELAAWTPIFGPKNAKVTIVEFSDFQCPFCSRVVPTVKEIETKYGKDVRVAFRHQPLPFHNHAMEAAEAAMAANAQGKFWPMHDKLFANQQKLDRSDLDGYAKEIGLNMAKYSSAMDQHLYKKQIEDDSKAGTSWGASGTPAFFINGQSLSGAQPFDSFKKVIDDEIKHADELIKGGTPMDKLYEKILATAKAPAPAPAAAAPAAPAAPTGPVDIAVGESPVKGPKSAPITVMIFSDFQCPFCSRVEPTLKQLEGDYKDKLKMVWKNAPLPFHDKAMPAAQAAMAAQQQGKFWEYHDKLFSNQQALDAPSLEKYAGEVGLNVDKWKAAKDSQKVKDQIAKDQAEAQKAGANGTPTFLINGRQLVGAQPVDAFKKLIDEELQKKK